MTKYRELMGHIEMTEEMKERVLGNVDAHFSRKARAKKRVIASAAGILAAAAVFGVVIFGRSVLIHETDVPEPEVLGIFNEQEYSSAKELSEAAGFSVAEIDHIPFEVEQTVYRLIGKDLAEIEYSGKKDMLTFRKSAGTEDNSGDYTEYKEVREVQADGKTVTLKGENGTYFLAVWQEEGFSCSLGDASGLDEESFLEMITDGAGTNMEDKSESGEKNQRCIDISRFSHLTDASYKVINKKIEETTKNKFVYSLSYPQLADAEHREVNEYIKETINSELNDVVEVDKLREKGTSVATDLNVDYEIKTKSEEFISIYFRGIYHMKNTAHPVNISFCINYDLKEKKEVCATDIVVDRERFIKQMPQWIKAYSDKDSELSSGLIHAVESHGYEQLGEKNNFYIEDGEFYIRITMPAGAIGYHYVKAS